MAVFLTVLKIIGMILLCILGLILFALLVVLFAPFRYELKVRKTDGFTAAGRIKWLFSGINATAGYFNGKKSLQILIFGRKLRRKKKDAGREGTVSTPNEFHVEEPACAKFEIPVDKPSEKSSKTVAREAKKAVKAEEKAKKKGSKKPAKFRPWSAENSLKERIAFTFHRICDTINLAGSCKAAWDASKKEVFAILKQLRPRKISGYVNFGFNDPSLTGKLLAFIAMLYPVLPKKLSLRPDFENAVFRCDVKAQGHIVVFVLLLHGFRLWRKKELRNILGIL